MIGLKSSSDVPKGRATRKPSKEGPVGPMESLPLGARHPGSEAHSTCGVTGLIGVHRKRGTNRGIWRRGCLVGGCREVSEYR